MNETGIRRLFRILGFAILSVQKEEKIMNAMKLAVRKLRLQLLQLKALKDVKHSQRYSEQKNVLFLLLSKPSVLFTTNHKNSKENQLFKYTNTLNRYVKDDHLYKMAKKYMVT